MGERPEGEVLRESEEGEEAEGVELEESKVGGTTHCQLLLTIKKREKNSRGIAVDGGKEGGGGGGMERVGGRGVDGVEEEGTTEKRILIIPERKDS